MTRLLYPLRLFTALRRGTGLSLAGALVATWMVWRRGFMAWPRPSGSAQ